MLGGLSQPLVILNFTTGFQGYGVGETKNFGPFNDSDSVNHIFNSGLAAFQQAGGGTFSVDCNSLSGVSITGGGGNIASNQTTTAGCGASINYTYDVPTTQVPEPTSITLLGLGLAGISFLRRRKAA